MTEFKLPSNRNFGIVFFVVFIVIALWPTSNGEGIWIWSLVISIILPNYSIIIIREIVIQWNIYLLHAKLINHDFSSKVHTDLG